MNRTLALIVLLPAVTLAAPVPKEGKDESRLYMTIGKKIISIAPDGTDEKTVCDQGVSDYDQLSPDGKWIVGVRHNPGKDRHSLMLREPGGTSKEVLLVSHQASVLWAADGKSLFGRDQKLVEGGKGGLVEAGRQCWRYELETGKQTMLDIPEKYTLIGETLDGKRLVYQHITGEQLVSEKPHLVYTQKQETVTSLPDKFEPEVLIPEAVNVSSGVPFPDGKRRLVNQLTPYMHDIGVFTLGEKKPVWWGLKGHYGGWAVSPNGKRVTYSIHYDRDENVGRKPEEYELWVADADGKNAKKIFTADKDITRIDWR